MTEATDTGAEIPRPAGGEDNKANPARELSLHLLRMLETRMEAAGLVFQAESQRLLSRLQLKALAAAAVFIALWGGIVLLAIALPPNLRVPVLGAIVAGFVLVAVWAVMKANRMIASREVGSLDWFLEGLKQDLEIFARSLARNAHAPPVEQPPPDQQRSPPSGIAA
jgi:uncharacterized membrane protein YqjE